MCMQSIAWGDQCHLHSYVVQSNYLESNSIFLKIFKERHKIERVEREVGGGIGMGKTCKLKAVSFQCMTKFTTN